MDPSKLTPSRAIADVYPLAAPPASIHVLPIGDCYQMVWNKDANEPQARALHFDESLLKKLADQANREATDVELDWNHLSFACRADKTIKNPAAAWLKSGSWTVKPDGLWVDVHSWTPEGAEAVKTGAYRYDSAGIDWIDVDSNTGEFVSRINHVSLTNQPLIDGLTPLSFSRGENISKMPLASRDHSWDSGEADKRVRTATNANDETNATYFDCFLWHAPNAKNYGNAKLLVCDVIDGKLHIIPKAIFAVAGVLQGGRGGVDIPDADKAAVKSRVESLYARMRKEFKDDKIIVPWAGKETSAARGENQPSGASRVKDGGGKSMQQFKEMCARLGIKLPESADEGDVVKAVEKFCRLARNDADDAKVNAEGSTAAARAAEARIAEAEGKLQTAAARVLSPAVAKELGFADDAKPTDEQALAAIGAKIVAVRGKPLIEVPAEFARALGAPDEKDPSKLLGLLLNLRGDARTAEMADKLSEQNTALARQAVENRLDGMVKDGRLAPVDRADYLSFLLSNDPGTVAAAESALSRMVPRGALASRLGPVAPPAKVGGGTGNKYLDMMVKEDPKKYNAEKLAAAASAAKTA